MLGSSVKVWASGIKTTRDVMKAGTIPLLTDHFVIIRIEITCLAQVCALGSGVQVVGRNRYISKEAATSSHASFQDSTGMRIHSKCSGGHRPFLLFLTRYPDTFQTKPKTPLMKRTSFAPPQYTSRPVSACRAGKRSRGKVCFFHLT